MKSFGKREKGTVGRAGSEPAEEHNCFIFKYIREREKKRDPEREREGKEGQKCTNRPCHVKRETFQEGRQQKSERVNTSAGGSLT